jgi:hypothetical protein
MTLSEEYRSYAADCDRMANYTRDPEGRAIWKQMAARWIRAAELEETHSARKHSHAPLRHGESAVRWAE